MKKQEKYAKNDSPATTTTTTTWRGSAKSEWDGRGQIKTIMTCIICIPTQSSRTAGAASVTGSRRGQGVAKKKNLMNATTKKRHQSCQDPHEVFNVPQSRMKGSNLAQTVDQPSGIWFGQAKLSPFPWNRKKPQSTPANRLGNLDWILLGRKNTLSLMLKLSF